MQSILQCKIKHYRSLLKKIIIGLCVLCVCACEEASILYKNIEETEANLMTSVLLREGVEATRMPNTDGTYNIAINDASYFSEAIEILSMRGFPRMKFENLCTIFKGDSMVSTPVEQKARYTCAKSQELSGSLTELDGVSMARVHLVLSETDPISRKVKPASASIMIKYKAGMDVDTLIPKIKQLVSYGVEELPYQNVSVMLSEELGQKENMIAQALHKSENNMGGQMMTESVTMQEDTEKSPNMLLLYILMGIIAVGMTVIIFLILHFKNQQFNNKFANPNNPENLPMEF